MKGLVFALFLFSVTAGAYEFDQNVPDDVRQQTIADLAFMQAVDGQKTSDLHQQIFGPLKGDSYTTFFNSRVKSIGMNSCGSPNAVACVWPMIPNKIFFSPNYTKFKHPQISRLMVVYHEARHTERQNGNWGHVTCPTPFLDENGQPKKSIWTGAELAGEPACDVTPFGSYGSSMILLKNISKFCTTCNEKVKMDAGIYADDQFGRVINENARQQIISDLYQ